MTRRPPIQNPGVLNPCLCGKRTRPFSRTDHSEGCPSRHLRLIGYMTPGDPTIWTGTNSFTPGVDTPVYVVEFGPEAPPSDRTGPES